MVTNKSFGDAIAALKQGKAVSRAGWNGKGMHVTLQRGAHDFTPANCPADMPVTGCIEGVNIVLFEHGPVGSTTRLPNLNMRSATGSTVTGWLASQTDMLAEDWCILN